MTDETAGRRWQHLIKGLLPEMQNKSAPPIVKRINEVMPWTRTQRIIDNIYMTDSVWILAFGRFDVLDTSMTSTYSGGYI